MTPMNDPRVLAAIMAAAGCICLAAICVAYAALNSTTGTLTSRRTNQLRNEMRARDAEHAHRLAELHAALVDQRWATEWDGPDDRTMALPLTTW